MDPTGKKAGRGAYLCRQVECWELALKRDRLSPALKVKLTAPDRERLMTFVETMKEAAAV